ncbi:class I SAM-dependent methyltransferase [Tepidibacter hydrothermalis]|uniref:Class I SAM-dependent methyltransferase n=1 Tax=Tepidibacter hydrothermalis TaxID=3036126 RepID=A0ABY8EJ95_9FIRM|nr:class I SAM-dependent methyltransferase [Tepidibacter hydrothermalis]WFD12145.1 class I SAM-dependent methyltransferase [Tepidibacter hydrothermalis]
MRSKYLTNVTDLTKLINKDIIKEGCVVIDATVGNGYDTQYLAEKVGNTGKVYGFDIQKEAIENTKKRLEKEKLFNNVTLILDGHENMDKYINEKVDSIFFNLGYLPKLDHNIKTKADTTIAALKKSLDLLKKNGILSICIYLGHDGGVEEKEAIEDLLFNLEQKNFDVLKCSFKNQKNNPPQLILVEKKVD